LITGPPPLPPAKLFDASEELAGTLTLFKASPYLYLLKINVRFLVAMEELLQKQIQIRKSSRGWSFPHDFPEKI
jgi:hypothetical protein